MVPTAQGQAGNSQFLLQQLAALSSGMPSAEGTILVLYLMAYESCCFLVRLEEKRDSPCISTRPQCHLFRCFSPGLCHLHSCFCFSRLAEYLQVSSSPESSFLELCLYNTLVVFRLNCVYSTLYLLK